MKNELTIVEQKEVDFNGAELMGIKANDGNIYAGMKWIIKGIGFTDRKGRAETTKAGKDEVISQGIRNFGLPTKGGKQQVSCINIEFLPLWLAKISVTPTIKEEQPEVAEKMVEYQLKAKDVLAEAFINNNPLNNHQIPETRAEALRLAADLEEEREKLEKENRRIKPKVRGNKDQWKSKMRHQIENVIYQYYSQIDNPYKTYNIVYANFDNYLIEEGYQNLNTFRKDMIQESLNEGCSVGYITTISENVLESLSVNQEMREIFEDFINDHKMELDLKLDFEREEM